MYEAFELGTRAHGDDRGPGDKSPFAWRLAHVERGITRHDQIFDGLIVNLDVLHGHGARVLLGHVTHARKDVVDGEQHDTRTVRGSHHCVRLAAPGGAVGKHTRVAAPQHVRHDTSSGALKGGLLRHRRIERVIKGVRLVLGLVEAQVVDAAHFVVRVDHINLASTAPGKGKYGRTAREQRVRNVRFV